MSLVAHGMVSSWPVLAMDLRGLAHELAEYHNMESGLCCPSIELITQRLGCTRRTVERKLEALETEGVIRRVARFVEGRRTTNEYQFLSHHPDVCDGDDPDTGVVYKREEVNRKYESGKNHRGCDRTGGQVPFLEFWSLWPKKVDKKNAEKKWNKLPLVKQKKALAFLSGNPYEGKDLQFVQGPCVFINGERWEDEAIKQGGPPQEGSAEWLDDMIPGLDYER